MKISYAILFKLTLLVLLLATQSCNHQLISSRIQAVEVIDYSSMMGQQSYKTFTYDSLVVFQAQYRFDSTINLIEFDSTIGELKSNRQFASQQWRNYYFIFHKDSTYGYKFDPHSHLDKNNYVRLKVDSITRLIKGTNRYDSFLKIKPDSALWSQNKTDYKEVYLIKMQKDTSFGQINFYYSKNLNHLQESFNRKVDSAKRMKLFKVEVFTKSFYDVNNKITWPSMTDISEMKKVTIEDEKVFLDYINIYKNAAIKSR